MVRREESYAAKTRKLEELLGDWRYFEDDAKEEPEEGKEGKEDKKEEE